MQYRHANGEILTRLRDINRIVRNAPGFTALPPRLVAELVGRAKEFLKRPVRFLLDPCCGSAGTLVIISMLLPDEVARIGANDISEKAIQLARRNLSLLSEQGLKTREHELAVLVEQFGKPVHEEALSSARALRSLRQAKKGPKVDISNVDIGSPGELSHALGFVRYDLIFTDLPYGQKVKWESVNSEATDILTTLLEACYDLAAAGGVIVAVVPRRMRAKQVDGFQQLGRIRGAGGREIHFFRKSN